MVERERHREEHIESGTETEWKEKGERWRVTEIERE